MSKFKIGDYVILREDARYPNDNSLWSTINPKLIPGELFRVDSVGEYSWGKEPIQDCISVLSETGWIPETCFDPVEIPVFNIGDIVECYRLPNNCDWTVTNCGKINHNLKVGERYTVSLLFSDNRNIQVVIDGESKGYFPPTIFRKVTLSSMQQLPEEWYVKCKHFYKDTPELYEWRDCSWKGEGYIDNNKIWYNIDKELISNEISYETFLEKVYKPWKAQQSTTSITNITSLPKKWAYEITEEDDLSLLNKYRLEGCSTASRFIDHEIRVGLLIFPFHEDGSNYYSNSITLFVKYHPDVTIISREMFYNLVINPWLKNIKKKEVVIEEKSITSLPEKWVYSLQNETPDRIKLIQEWRLSVCEKTYRSYSLYNVCSVCNHEDCSYFYSGSPSEYISTCEGVIEITKEIFDKFVLQPWMDRETKSDSKISQQKISETLKIPTDRIVRTNHIGARVVRGRDWEWEEQGNNTTGTIIDESDLLEWIRVKWDNGDVNSYRIGDENKYDLYYAEDQTPSTVKQYPLTYSEITPPIETSISLTTSYQSVLSSTPHLIINKPKKRLFSTEVQELNVNLKLLKTQ